MKLTFRAKHHGAVGTWGYNPRYVVGPNWTPRHLEKDRGEARGEKCWPGRLLLVAQNKGYSCENNLYEFLNLVEGYPVVLVVVLVNNTGQAQHRDTWISRWGNMLRSAYEMNAAEKWSHRKYGRRLSPHVWWKVDLINHTQGLVKKTVLSSTMTPPQTPFSTSTTWMDLWGVLGLVTDQNKAIRSMGVALSMKPEREETYEQL